MAWARTQGSRRWSRGLPSRAGNTAAQVEYDTTRWRNARSSGCTSAISSRRSQSPANTQGFVSERPLSSYILRSAASEVPSIP